MKRCSDGPERIDMANRRYRGQRRNQLAENPLQVIPHGLLADSVQIEVGLEVGVCGDFDRQGAAEIHRIRIGRHVFKS
jgi:hypothetical protein